MVSTTRNPSIVERRVNGRRYSSCSVSGSRMAVQPSTTSVSTAIMTKIHGQPDTSMMPWPSVGATIGTAMKTMKTSDITSAMARPPKTSRMTETAMTRVEAAPKPCTKRRTSSSVKSRDSAAAKAAMT